MKGFFTLLIILLSFTACSLEDDSPNSTLKFIPIVEYTVPSEFAFGVNNDITVTYRLPTSCYTFYSLYYSKIEFSRIIAINAMKENLENCDTDNQIYEYTFPINVTQREDYLLKFWKGIDVNGDNIYEEVIVPVN